MCNISRQKYRIVGENADFPKIHCLENWESVNLHERNVETFYHCVFKVDKLTIFWANVVSIKFLLVISCPWIIPQVMSKVLLSYSVVSLKLYYVFPIPIPICKIMTELVYVWNFRISTIFLELQRIHKPLQNITLFRTFDPLLPECLVIQWFWLK